MHIYFHINSCSHTHAHRHTHKHTHIPGCAHAQGNTNTIAHSRGHQHDLALIAMMSLVPVAQESGSNGDPGRRTDATTTLHAREGSKVKRRMMHGLNPALASPPPHVHARDALEAFIAMDERGMKKARTESWQCQG